MRQNKRRKAKIEKAFQDYETIVEFGRLGRLGRLTPYEVGCIQDVLKDLSEGKAAETISESVAWWFARRKFCVEQSGIGWKIR